MAPEASAVSDLAPLAVAVACSGGRDSMAMLHAVVRVAAELAREGPGQPPIQVWALHVHHGLSAHADDWWAHVEGTCQDWQARGWPVSACVRHVCVPRGSSEGLEAAARRLRHEALHAMCDELGASLLLLAHHRRDQAETVLLQALRGASVAGLAGMPRLAWRGGVAWARPWLDRPREEVEAYVRLHGVRHIEDDSNADARHARNRLRLAVWPVLAQAFPHLETALSQTAACAADAAEVVQAWAGEQVGQARQAALGGQAGAWPLAAWRQWPAALRRESLRHWYRQCSGRGLSASWVRRLADELPRLLDRGAAARWPAVGLSLYRGALVCAPAAPGFGDALPFGEPVQTAAGGMLGEGVWRFAGAPGCYEVRPAVSGGLNPRVLPTLRPRPRQGGEQWQAGAGRPPRALKKQFQTAGVPAWERAGAPLWAGEALVFVPGLGVDARWRMPDGAPQWAIQWHPGPDADSPSF